MNALLADIVQRHPTQVVIETTNYPILCLEYSQYHFAQNRHGHETDCDREKPK
jgi:hypothetical protein